MADRYWRGGTATWDGTAGSKWAATAGGATGASAPTSADTVYFDASSTGTVTLSSAAVCRNLDMTGHTGTLTGVAGLSLTIGDASGGYIIWGSGTYTGNASGSRIDFVASSTNGGSGWGLTQNGKTLTNWQYNFSNASGMWTCQDDLSLGTSGSGQITHTSGHFKTNDKTISSVQWLGTGTGSKTLSIGASTLNAYGNSNPFQYASSTNLTVNSNTATLNVLGAAASIIFGNFDWAGLSLSRTSAGTMTISGTTGAILNNVTFSGTASRTDTVSLNSVTFTVTGVFTLSGNNSNANRLYIANTGQRGIQSTITINGSYGTVANVDFMDVAITGSAGTMTGTSLGDAQGNSGITFDSSTTQTYTSGAADAHASWTSRVPLPQDNVVFNASSANVTLLNPRLGKNIDFTGYTNTVTMGSNMDIFGSFTASSTMTFSNWNITLTFGGRGSYTITMAGKSIASSPVLNAPGGTLTQADAATFSGGWIVTQGSWTTGNYSLTAQQFTSTGSLTRSINLGTSTITATGTGNITYWNVTATGLTLSASQSTITLGTTSTQERIFSGAGLIYGAVNYNINGSTGSWRWAGSNVVDSVAFSDSTNARTWNITAGTVNGIKTFAPNGTSGKLMTIQSLTAGSPVYLKITGAPQSIDYLSVKDVYSVMGHKFYAGTNSTNVSGNLNVLFTTAPTQPYLTEYNDGTFAATSGTASMSGSRSAVAGRVLVVVVATASSNTPISVGGGAYTLVDTIKQDSTNTSVSVYIKIASGGETTAAISMNNSNTTYWQMMEVGGFSGTPSVDVYDSNTIGGGSSTSLSTGAGVSNTAQPAFAIAAFSKSSSFGTSTSFTNSFQESRLATQLTNLRVATLPLLTTGSVSTTYTYQTAGTRGASRLVVIKDSSGTAWSQTPSDTASISDTATKTITKVQGDTITITDLAVRAVAKPIADTATITDAIVKAITKNPNDTISIADQIVKTLSLPKSDTATVTDALSKAFGKNAADSISMSDLITSIGNFTKAIADSVTITDDVQITATQTYALSVADGVSVTDTIALEFSGVTNWYERQGDTWYQKSPVAYLEESGPGNWYTKP